MYKIPANTVFIGKKVHYLPSCHSTNDVAYRLINAGNPEGTVVITDEQYAGKGQKGNTWETEPGQNLTFSIILYPNNIPPSRQFELTRVTTLGITDFISDFLQVRTQIKWPNDIIYNGKKLAGILINTSVSGNKLTDAIIGIGLNVNQVKFELTSASSLSLITGKNYNLQVVLEGLLEAIEKRYRRIFDKVQVLNYLDRLLGYKEERIFRDSLTKQEFKGTIRGLDDMGRLLVESGGKEHRYNMKEIEFLSLL